MRTVLFLLALGMAGPTLAYPVSTTFGGSDGEVGGWVAPLPDGGLLLLGGTRSAGPGDMDLLLVRLAADRSVVWQRTLGGPREEYPGELHVLSDGAILSFVSGLRGADSRTGVARLDMQGNVLWQVLVSDASARASLFAPRLLLLPDRFVLAGLIADNPAGAVDGWLAALDLFGNPLWERRLDAAGSDLFTGAALLDTGDIMAVGSTSAAHAIRGLLATFTPNGDLAWSRTLEGPTGSEIQWAAGPVEGRVLLTGWAERAAGMPPDALAVAVTASGDVEWSTTLGLADTTEVALVAFPAGSGFLLGGARGSDGLVARLEGDGTWAWAGAVGGVGRDVVTLARPSGARVLASGITESFGQGNSDFWLLELDALLGRLPASCDLVRAVDRTSWVGIATIPVAATVTAGPASTTPSMFPLLDASLTRWVHCERPLVFAPLPPRPGGGTRPVPLDRRR